MFKSGKQAAFIQVGLPGIDDRRNLLDKPTDYVSDHFYVCKPLPFRPVFELFGQIVLFAGLKGFNKKLWFSHHFFSCFSIRFFVVMKKDKELARGDLFFH